MGAIMMKLNTSAKALAATALLALLVGLLTAFTLDYTPDQGQEIAITSGHSAVSRGQLSRPW